MRGNQITLRLNRGFTARAGSLFQYDRGQRLLLTGVDLPENYQVHFSNEELGVSKSVIGDRTGADIPDEYLISGQPIHVWVYVSGEDHAETEYHGIIGVTRRALPTDVAPSPAQQSLIDQTLGALAAAVEHTEEIRGHVEEISESMEDSSPPLDASLTLPTAAAPADQVGALKSALQDKPDNSDDGEENADLDVTDEDGNVIVRFADGGIKTKEFDSAAVGKVMHDASGVDLDISDLEGNVIARFEDGHLKTLKFDSAEVYGVSAETSEINLADQPKVSFNFEYGNTWTSTAYRGALIPAGELGNAVRFAASSNKIVCAFLRDNDIAAGRYPNVCEGTTVLRMGVGADATVKVPDDCGYLYVYLSQNDAFIGTIHVYSIVSATKMKSMLSDLQKQIDEISGRTGMCFITDTEQVIRALKHWHTNTYNDFRAYTSGDDLVTIAHISDVHNDPDAYGRFIRFLNDYVGVIDCGIVSGDLVDGPGSECFAEMVAEEASIAEGAKVLKVVGNHDVISSTPEGLFNDMNMSISTDGDDLYYVHDFADRKIRVIVLNQYDTAAGTRGKTGHYSQDQLDWFVARLSEAVADHYQVIVAYHSCSEAGWPKRNGKGFCQNTLMGFNESVSGEHIIEDIVNAFQTGGSLVKSVTYPDSGTTVSVNAAFASKGTFVCYICGHAHVDFIGYSRVYPNQLVCMVQGAVINSSVRSEEQAHWQGMYDTPRIAGTSTQDSINVYAIDPLSRLVKVVKIGSTMTDKFVPRSFATFGY